MSGGSRGKSQPGSGCPPQGFTAMCPTAYVACFTSPGGPMPDALTHTAIYSNAHRIFGHDIVTAVIYSGAGIAAFLLLHATLRIVHRFADTTSGRMKTPSQPAKTKEQFIQEAGLLHISERIAAETYKALVSSLPERTSFSPNDDLRSQLSLPEDQIVAILYSLPQSCGRLPHAFDVAAIVSVYDLLAHIEAAPMLRSAKSLQRVACSGAAAPSDTTISPLAGLQNASPRDSRFRTRPHFSGLKRRATDYSGPHRRATDKTGDVPYSGPLRRVSDPSSPPIDPAARKQEPRQSEQRQQERRQHPGNYPDLPAKMHSTALASGTHRSSERTLTPPAPDPQPRPESAPNQRDLPATSGRWPAAPLPEKLAEQEALSSVAHLQAL